MFRKATESLKLYNLDEMTPIRKLFGLPPPPAPPSPSHTDHLNPGGSAQTPQEDSAAEEEEERTEEEGMEEDMVMEDMKKEMKSMSPGSADKKLEKELAALGIIVQIR